MDSFGSLLGKVVIVFGGTSGIGKATAVALCANGAHVVVCGRREAAGEQVVQTLVGAGGKAVFVQCNVSVESDVRQAIAAAVATYGKLDGAFNNSGVYNGTPHSSTQLLSMQSQVCGSKLLWSMVGMAFELTMSAPDLCRPR
jgi:NAD(P)-dependent dehydrogenase (short-subunit alcohol dehydrogenase family)